MSRCEGAARRAWQACADATLAKRRPATPFAVADTACNMNRMRGNTDRAVGVSAEGVNRARCCQARLKVDGLEMQAVRQ